MQTSTTYNHLRGKTLFCNVSPEFLYVMLFITLKKIVKCITSAIWKVLVVGWIFLFNHFFAARAFLCPKRMGTRIGELLN